MDEKSIDARIEHNNIRMEMLQKHIDKLTEHKQKISDDNTSLQVQKAQIIKDKEIKQ